MNLFHVLVSEGDSVFEVSSGASTSSKTQSQKMPIQPSFRSRGRSTKAASSSRGSDKNQGGSFLDSVKEALDEGGSAPAKGVGSSEPKVQEVGLPSEVPMAEADPQMVRDPPEFEPRGTRGPELTRLTDLRGLPPPPLEEEPLAGTLLIRSLDRFWTIRGVWLL
ncbi:uncharacterized protein LOC130499743 [Raphanus sativus]|uniref:Uncharacterized protein LOC130499743 n=1 Tax=Raphanus sativus TaxID=3726 RepID=A0A9W3CEX2_RAPSA|nr:uncharacterized protein LOC130499743 [Raphanus sativus]